jgi:hypothetical protein
LALVSLAVGAAAASVLPPQLVVLVLSTNRFALAAACRIVVAIAMVVVVKMVEEFRVAKSVVVSENLVKSTVSISDLEKMIVASSRRAAAAAMVVRFVVDVSF